MTRGQQTLQITVGRVDAGSGRGVVEELELDEAKQMLSASMLIEEGAGCESLDSGLLEPFLYG